MKKILVLLTAFAASLLIATSGTASAAPAGAITAPNGATAQQTSAGTYEVHDKTGEPLGTVVIPKQTGVHPNVSVDFGNGLYVYLTPLEQQTLLGAGAAALGIAICAIPAVGQISCGVVSAALAGATVYLSDKGICKGRLEIRAGGFHTSPYDFKCV